jgi:hypothetical protein
VTCAVCCMALVSHAAIRCEVLRCAVLQAQFCTCQLFTFSPTWMLMPCAVLHIHTDATQASTADVCPGQQRTCCLAKSTLASNKSRESNPMILLLLLNLPNLKAATSYCWWRCCGKCLGSRSAVLDEASVRYPVTAAGSVTRQLPSLVPSFMARMPIVCHTTHPVPPSVMPCHPPAQHHRWGVSSCHTPCVRLLVLQHHLLLLRHNTRSTSVLHATQPAAASTARETCAESDCEPWTQPTRQQPDTVRRQYQAACNTDEQQELLLVVVELADTSKVPLLPQCTSRRPGPPHHYLRFLYSMEQLTVHTAQNYLLLLQQHCVPPCCLATPGAPGLEKCNPTAPSKQLHCRSPPYQEVSAAALILPQE